MSDAPEKIWIWEEEHPATNAKGHKTGGWVDVKPVRKAFPYIPETQALAQVAAMLKEQSDFFRKKETEIREGPNASYQGESIAALEYVWKTLAMRTGPDAKAALESVKEVVRQETAQEAMREYGPVGMLLLRGIAEAERAMKKFPQPNYVISKWAEETGEVTKAAIHYAEGGETVENLCEEIVQSLAMLHRLIVEGDEVHGIKPFEALINKIGADND